MTALYFLHGMESSPKGTKAQFLRNHFPHCRIPALPPDIQQRQKILRSTIDTPAWIVGSSLGGLSALMLAKASPTLVKGMTLLAPAVGCYDSRFFSPSELTVIEQTVIPAGIPCTIIAGKNDDLIPLSSIENLIRRSHANDRIQLLVVDDDHSLNRSLDLLLTCVQKMIGRTTPEPVG
jgi:esterase/lipase